MAKREIHNVELAIGVALWFAALMWIFSDYIGAASGGESTYAKGYQVNVIGKQWRV